VGLLETLRRRPELVVGPALGFWLLANCLPITFGQPFVIGVFGEATFHHTPGNVFPITYACALLLFGFALYALGGLSWPRRILVAVAFPFAFTHFYEVPYDLIAYWVWYPLYDWALWPITLFLNASWLILGASTFPFWKLDRRAGVVLAGFLASFAVWWIWFLPFLPPIAPPQNPEGSGYILSKVILALLFACLLWAGRPERRPAGVEAQTGLPSALGPTVSRALDSPPAGGDAHAEVSSARLAAATTRVNHPWLLRAAKR
jgi:hypothetical protein